MTSRRAYRYRVNYGNGQVDYVPGHTRRACNALIAAHLGGGPPGYVEFQDPDTREWFRTGNA